MRWVGRRGIHVHGTATGSPIRRFIDPKAEFLFAEPDDAVKKPIGDRRAR